MSDWVEDDLIASIEVKVLPRILDHSFIRGLVDGTLPAKVFKNYILQDMLFLKDFAIALPILSTKADEEEDKAIFAEQLKNSLVVERDLHTTYLASWGIDSESLVSAERSLATSLYGSYLMEVAQECAYYEALGAFLPCYWLYSKVERVLLEKGSVNMWYQKWIETYASPNFEQDAYDMIGIIKRVCSSLDADQKAAVKRRSLRAAQLEWLFWESAYAQDVQFI